MTDAGVFRFREPLDDDIAIVQTPAARRRDDLLTELIVGGDSDHERIAHRRRRPFDEQRHLEQRRGFDQPFVHLRVHGYATDDADQDHHQ